MALQTSGAISLNDIHVEAGGTSGTTVSLNDEDIRGLISKTSGASMSFSEWYGAAGIVLPPPNWTYTIGVNNSVNRGYYYSALSTATPQQQLIDSWADYPDYPAWPFQLKSGSTVYPNAARLVALFNYRPNIYISQLSLRVESISGQGGSPSLLGSAIENSGWTALRITDTNGTVTTFYRTQASFSKTTVGLISDRGYATWVWNLRTGFNNYEIPITGSLTFSALIF